MINCERHYLWRAVARESEVLESFVTKTRDKKAALKFLKKAMKRHGRPEAIVTDRLRSHGAALKDVRAADRQETGRCLNNRAENSHPAYRRRERAMLRFRRKRGLQKLAFVHASVTNHFNSECSLSSRPLLKANRAPLLRVARIGLTTTPREHWPQIASINPFEWVSREIKRRADVVGIFPNGDGPRPPRRRAYAPDKRRMDRRSTLHEP